MYNNLLGSYTLNTSTSVATTITFSASINNSELGNILYIPGYLKMKEDKDFILKKELDSGQTGALFSAQLVGINVKGNLIAVKVLFNTTDETFLFEVSIMQ